MLEILPLFVLQMMPASVVMPIKTLLLGHTVVFDAKYCNVSALCKVYIF